MSSHNSTPSATTTPRNNSSQNLTLLFMIFFLFFTILEVKNCRKKKGAEAETKKAQVSAIQPTPTRETATEALVLMYECYTPCSYKIQWKFKLQTDGHPLKVKFHGMSNWYTLPAEGNVKIPFTMNVGEAYFESVDNKPVRVEVYRRTTTTH